MPAPRRGSARTALALLLALVVTSPSIVAAAVTGSPRAALFAEITRAGATVRGAVRATPGGPALAWGTFVDAINETGWHTLSVTSNASYSDAQQAYAAGFLEGALTPAPILDFVSNKGLNATLPAPVDDFLAANAAFVAEQVASNVSSYWHQVALVYEQLDGLADGYNHAAGAGSALPRAALHALNLHPELGDLPSGGGRGDASHCSALVRLAPGDAELLAGHATWAGLEDLLRVWKTYTLPYSTDGGAGAPTVPGHTVSFASYPGRLVSADDWYALSSGLLVMETTIGNANATLAALYVRPNTVMEWVRNVVANRLAASGAEWARHFGAHNSGTYNCEWLVVDYVRFTPGAPPVPGTLTMLDQIPGFVVSWDATPELRARGYVGSYNLPADAWVYNVSGVEEKRERGGDHWSYERTARAQMLARDAPGVVDEPAFQRLLRYNDFRVDPLARQGCAADPGPAFSAVNAIAARADLNDPDGAYPIPSLGFHNLAALDAKATSWRRMVGPDGPLRSLAQSGPTYDNQPAFAWSRSALNATVRHAGVPNEFRFPWVVQPSERDSESN